MASYRSIPATSAVRLAKPTSNLFRARTKRDAPGLDTSGLTGVLGVDPEARTADVAGMCTYEDLVAATLPYGLSPLVVPQLKTITLGGAVSGLGIESASFRNGLPHESVLEMDILTGAGELLTASRTQHPDLFRAFPNSYGTLGYSTRLRIELEPVAPFVALRHVRFHSLPDDGRRDGTHHRHRRARRHPGRLSRRRGVQRRRKLPVRRQADHHPGPGQRLHRARHLLPVDPARLRGRGSHQGRPADHPRLLLALGHRLVLVLARVRRAEPAAAALVAAPLPAQQRLLEARRPGPALRHRRPDRDAQRPSPCASGWSRTSRCRSNGPRVLGMVPGQRADHADLVVPVAASRSRRLAAVSDPAGPHLRQCRLLVVGAGRRQRKARRTGRSKRR